MSDEVSAEEAQAWLAEMSDMDRGRSRAARLARTVLTLRERHAAEVAQARREGAGTMRAAVAGLLLDRGAASGRHAFVRENERAAAAVLALPLPGEEVPRDR